MLVTTYVGNGKALLAIASWAPDTVNVTLNIDWNALGLETNTVTITAPPIDSFQVTRIFNPGDSIPVAPARGWLLELR